MDPTELAVRKAWQQIENYVTASVEESWSGTLEPAEAEKVRREYKRIKKQLDQWIREVMTDAKTSKTIRM